MVRIATSESCSFFNSSSILLLTIAGFELAGKYSSLDKRFSWLSRIGSLLLSALILEFT
jgi:hypothetical protein